MLCSQNIHLLAREQRSRTSYSNYRWKRESQLSFEHETLLFAEGRHSHTISVTQIQLNSEFLCHRHRCLVGSERHNAVIQSSFAEGCVQRRVCFCQASRVVAGSKNSYSVVHACRKRPLKWIASVRGRGEPPCLWRTLIRSPDLPFCGWE